MAEQHRHCDRDRDRDVVTTTCDFGYVLDPPGDAAGNVYSAGWTQLAIKPRRGRCVSQVSGSVHYVDARLEAWSPTDRIDRGANTLTMPLGDADHPSGRLRTTFQLAKGWISIKVDRSSSGDTLYWRWHGVTGRQTIVIPIGTEFLVPPPFNPLDIGLSTGFGLATSRC